MHWSLARRKRHAMRLLDEFLHAVGRRDGPRLLGDRREERLLVDFLERVAVDMPTRQHAGERNHGRVRRFRLRQPGDEIRGSRPVLSRQDHTGVSGCACVAVGHVGAGSFVVDGDEFDGAVVQGIEQLHRCRADQPKDVAGRFGLECGDGGLAA